MIAIKDKLVSNDIVKEEFHCNLNACKGVCCVEGDTGAPLEVFEMEILDHIYPMVEPYLSEEGKAAIKEQGKYNLDKEDGVFKTPLIQGKACAYAIKEEGTIWCGIEKAWKDGKIPAEVADFKKPISCHLYPIRVEKNEHFEALNYEEWEICDAACALGKELKLPVYKFLKEALVRKYGIEFYETLEATAKHMENG